MKCQDWIYIKIIEFISSLQICIANQYVSNHPSQRTEQPRVQTNGYQRILVHLKNVQIPAIVCQFSSQQPKCYAKNRYVRWKFISLEFFTLRFFCFLSKIYWPSILVHFDWKTSLISAIIRMTHKKSSETTDGCHVSAIEKNLKKDTVYQTFILCPKIAKNSNLLSSKKKVEMVACYNCNVKCAWSRVSNFESTFLHFASSPNK